MTDSAAGPARVWSRYWAPRWAPGRRSDGARRWPGAPRGAPARPAGVLASDRRHQTKISPAGRSLLFTDGNDFWRPAMRRGRPAMRRGRPAIRPGSAAGNRGKESRRIGWLESQRILRHRKVGKVWDGTLDRRYINRKTYTIQGGVPENHREASRTGRCVWGGEWENTRLRSGWGNAKCNQVWILRWNMQGMMNWQSPMNSRDILRYERIGR